jgi:3-oxoacyl-[acyl-carrier protein] reductase
MKDKVAIITGSSRGIGSAIARTFAEEGAHIVLNGRHTPSAALDRLAGELSGQGRKVLVVRGDVGTMDCAHELVSRTIDAFGAVHVLVNNAGVSPMASIEEISPDEWDEVFRINLKSSFLCGREVFPIMKKQNTGCILNISSCSGKSGGIGAHYAASKAGMNSLTRTLAFEGAPYGIRANAIAPGPIETDMVREMFEDQRRSFLESIIPLGRLGTVQDIADAALFLCSDNAGFVTGEVLEIDGGLTWFKPLSYPSQIRAAGGS